MRASASLWQKTQTVLLSALPVAGIALLTLFVDFSPNTHADPKLIVAVKEPVLIEQCAVSLAYAQNHDHLLKSAQKGHIRAAYQIAKIYKNAIGANCQQFSFKWFSKAAEGGETKAYAELGNAYRKGRGVEVNFKKSEMFFYKSAKHGFVSSAFSLINLVERGDSEIAPNARKAKRHLDEFLPLIQKGINSGNAIAARSLARLYERSTLVERDLDKAISLYELASKTGDAIAKHDLALIVLKERTKSSSQEYAVKLLHESVALGHPASFTALGRLHIKTEFGLPREEALSWFERGAERGHGGAYQELAKLYMEGKLVAQDYDKAFAYAVEGHKLGHKGARRLLSEMRELDLSEEG